MTFIGVNSSGQRVRSRWAVPLLAALTLGASLWAANGDRGPWVLGTPDEKAATAQLARDYGMQVAQSATLRYANGNTGFRLEQNVQHRDVYIDLPAKVDPNQLVELLFMSETARTGFAHRVILTSKVPLEQVKIYDSAGARIQLDLVSLFRTAGAEYFTQSEGPKLVLRKLPSVPQPEARKVGDAFVVSQGHPELATAIAGEMGIALKDSAEASHAIGKKVYVVEGFGQPVNENMIKTIALAQQLTASGNEVHLVTPYLPYARSDKMDQPGVAVLGSLAVRLLKSTGARALTLMRAHAPQSQGFFEGASQQLSGRPTVLPYLREKGINVVLSPDAGAEKDAKAYARDLGVAEVAIVSKEREKKSGLGIEIRGGTNAGSLAGATVLIADDEIGSGGTIAAGAQWAHDQGAKEIYVVATHSTGPASAALASPYVKEILVTDTVPVTIHNPKLKVLSVAKELSAALRDLESRRREGAEDCDAALSRIASGA